MATKHTEFQEALMRAWVAGWYAGRDGLPTGATDDGKREAAERLQREFPIQAAATKVVAALSLLVAAVEAHERRTGVVQMHPAIELARAALAEAGQEGGQ